MGPEQFFVFGITLIVLLAPSAQGVECFSCKDCETLNSSLIVECPKSRPKCVKIVYNNGVVDRTCGDSGKCTGRDGFQFYTPTPRPRRSITPPQDGLIRRKRGLLEPPSGKGDDFKELASLYCCNEPECNGVPSYHLASLENLAFLLLSLYFVHARLD